MAVTNMVFLNTESKQLIWNGEGREAKNVFTIASHKRRTGLKWAQEIEKAVRERNLVQEDAQNKLSRRLRWGLRPQL